MPKVPAKKTQLATNIPAKLHDALRAYSDETGISITRLVEDALRAFLTDKTGKKL